MKNSNWTLEQLKLSLSRRKGVKSWIITEEHVHRRERYFLSDSGILSIDQDRNINAKNLSLRLFVHLPNPTRHGEITKKLFPALPLEAQLDSAISTALETDHQSWELPPKPTEQNQNLLTTDPAMAEDLDKVMDHLTSRIQSAVSKKRAAVFNSSELFLSIHNTDLYMSTGLVQRASQSRIYSEAAFSFSKKDPNGKMQSDEYLSAHWAVDLQSLPLEKIFDETSHCAENSLDVIKPLTGKYSVIIDSEVLSSLLHGHISQLYASHSYNNLPFIKAGDSFIPESHGDLLTIQLDPTMDYGASTLAVSEQGLAQSPLCLVDKNKVVATAVDKQYGDYLELPPTTNRGNLVVDAGALSHTELCKQAPQVVEILQFSGLFSDPNSGTFSSEIRLAKLYDNKTGKVRFLKGGSLSGSISENFKNLKLSNSIVKRAHFSSEGTHGQGYRGPEYALLTDVSIVG